MLKGGTSKVVVMLCSRTHSGKEKKTKQNKKPKSPIDTHSRGVCITDLVLYWYVHSFFCSVVSAEERMYVFGGRNIYNFSFNDLYCYDFGK